jgi:hypothetical protein
MPRTAARRLNAADIIQALRGGRVLHRSFERPRTRWWLSDGREVDSGVAEAAIADPAITPAGDGLFPHGPAQTYRAAPAANPGRR